MKPLFEAIIIGGVTEDTNIINGSKYESIGGGVTYIAYSLMKLGVKIGIVSKCNPRSYQKFRNLVKGEFIDLSGISVDEDYNINFVNIYRRDARIQRATAPSYKISIDDIPKEYLNSKVAIVTPVLGEIDHDIIPWLRDNGLITVIELQGFVRKIQNDKIVIMPLDKDFPVEKADILKADIEEFKVGFKCTDTTIRECFKKKLGKGPWIVGITLGREGSILYLNSHLNELYRIYPLDVDAIDTTGAGDLYLSGLVYGFLKYGDALLAGRYASALSSYATMFKGISFDISPSQLEDLVVEIRWSYLTNYRLDI
jgi:sugar/nucleoside kinase (ribokinase family)